MAQIIPVDPFDYVVFGALGDLAKRKLFPALLHRDLDGQIPSSARIIGAGRQPFSDQEFQAQIFDALKTFVPDDSQDDQAIGQFLSRLTYCQIDVCGRRRL